MKSGSSSPTYTSEPRRISEPQRRASNSEKPSSSKVAFSYIPCRRALVRQRYRNVAPGLPVFQPSVRMARGHIGSPSAEC